MEFGICNYRNCNRSLEQRRKGAKFCSSSCKSAEKTYIKRYKDKIEKYKAVEMERVKQIKILKKLIKDMI
jgi:hypothetical protein